MNREVVIESKGEKLAIYCPSSSWGKGLTFLTEDKDFIQVGIWRYDKGKKLQAHIHNEVTREITRTQEVIFVKSGKVVAHIFNEEEELAKSLELHPGDVLIVLRGGHGYDVIEDNTSVLEIKNGPYPGAEADRRRIG
jgi:hypothetical protein